MGGRQALCGALHGIIPFVNTYIKWVRGRSFEPGSGGLLFLAAAVPLADRD